VYPPSIRVSKYGYIFNRCKVSSTVSMLHDFCIDLDINIAASLYQGKKEFYGCVDAYRAVDVVFQMSVLLRRQISCD